MKNADVVIGANWGDEGKGLVTDFLANRHGEDALVVRFNGGAQAGHTVTTPEGKRHVFNHFGSGSLCGSATYLSRFFVCNPILFLDETKRLAKIGVRPRVYIDPASPITTPYDMMINQMVEELRGAGRHGSCGVGFGETVERQQFPEFALTFADLYNLPKLRAKLETIRIRWTPARLRKLGVLNIKQEWRERFSSDGVLNHFIKDVEAFLEWARPATVSLMSRSKHVIFEGSQGLLLDQDHHWFPHVTRSNTGLKNVVTLAKSVGYHELNVHYVSRSYATRHGAGPLPHEVTEKPYDKIVDLTNVPNPYQGTLRFGSLDLDLLQKTIYHDLVFAENLIAVKPILAVSCVDQIDNVAQFIHKGSKCAQGVQQFLSTVGTLIPGSTVIASFGPTRETIRPVRPSELSHLLYGEDHLASFAPERECTDFCAIA